MREQNVIHELHQKVRFLTKEVNERLKKHQLYSSQWSILYVLNKIGEVTQNEISKYLNVEPPTITRTVSRLEASGWIKRTFGEDQREKIVELTSKGKELFPEVEKTIQQFENDMLQHLSKHEQQVVITLLNKIKG